MSWALLAGVLLTGVALFAVAWFVGGLIEQWILPHRSPEDPKCPFLSDEDELFVPLIIGPWPEDILGFEIVPSRKE